MNRSIFLFSLSFCLYPTANEILAQAYPDSMACWNVLNLNNNTCISTSFVMGPEPDTLIFGETYKRIIRFQDSWCFTGDWQPEGELYVRSDDVGRGYVFLLDSMQEYLAIDNNAQAGDTVYHVLMSGMDGEAGSVGLGNVFIDSVYALIINGVTITRQIVKPLCCGTVTPELAMEIFWQVGMGASFGPMLDSWAGDGFHQIQCMRILDTNVYRTGSTSGIECDCPFELTVNINRVADRTLPAATPNPSTGLFHLAQASAQITVYNAQGRLLFRQHGNEVDLSAYPPGVYTAVVQTAKGRNALRLVVMQ